MSDGPQIQIDSDWKKQAQEEKRRLAEQEAAAKAKPAAPASSARPQRDAREMPKASFESLVQSIITQAYYYLGDLSPRGTEPNVQLDMARHQIDLLTVLEDKSRGNLDAAEQQLMDSALYEVRTRFVGVASAEII